MQEAWERIARSVLLLLVQRHITPPQAESWLWALVEYAEKFEVVACITVTGVDTGEDP